MPAAIFAGRYLNPFRVRAEGSAARSDGRPIPVAIFFNGLYELCVPQAAPEFDEQLAQYKSGLHLSYELRYVSTAFVQRRENYNS